MATPAASRSNGNLTLLRVFGASALTPAALVHEGASASALTLVGIADPKAQGGERAATTVAARLDGDSLDPSPQLGFAGAAAVDAQGRIFGMVTLKAPVLASAGAASLPARNGRAGRRRSGSSSIRNTSRPRPAAPASMPRRRRWCG